jgi:serine/threonine protein kinase
MEDGGINLMNFITKMKQKGQKIPSNVIEIWIKVLLENFAWLANNGIFHRDIKPHNLLVNEQDMTLKIIDFGVGDISEIESTYSPTLEFPIQGTSGYMAPELCEALEKNLSSDYHKPGKSDVFSLGLTFYQLITFENISGLNIKLNNNLLLQKVQDLNCKVWVKKLLECMLQYEWRKRPSFGKLLCFIPSENTNENSISGLIPLSLDLDSIVFQTRLVYSRTFPTFDVKILRGVTRDNIPIIKKQYFSFTQNFDPSHISKEIEIMTLLSNQKTNINTFIRLYDVKRTPDEISLFMEDGGENLMNFLTKTKKNGQVLPPNVLEEWVKILLNSFAYLYNMKIFHRDIKPHNILVNEKDMTLKIIDFGIGDFIERDSTFSTTMEFPIQGAFGYMAPELCEALENNSRVAFYKPGKSDVFSLGLTFYQLLTCENLQGMNIKLNNQVLLQKVQKLNCKVWIKNLLHSMLQYEWRKRPSFNKLLSFIPSDRDTQ